MRFDWLQTRDSKPLTDQEKLCQEYFNKYIYRPDLGDTYTLLKIPDFDNIYDTLNEADKIRFEWLAEHPDAAYFDFDCVPVRRFNPPEKNKVYLPLNPYYLKQGKQVLDIFLIYVNGDTEWIKTHLNQEIKDTYLLENKHKVKDNFYGFPFELMDKYSGYEIIPDEYYEHGNLTMHTLQKEESMNNQKQSLPTLAQIDESVINTQQNINNISQLITGLRNNISVYQEAVRNLNRKAQELQQKNDELEAENTRLVAENTNYSIENNDLKEDKKVKK